MTVDVRPFHPSDLRIIQAQVSQASALIGLSDADCIKVAEAGPAFTLVGRDGVLVGAGGISPKWPGSALAWAIVGRTITKRQWVFAHHFVAHVLDAAEYERIEAHVENASPAAHHWARKLGFEPEGLMKKFRHGRDFMLYARVQ